MIPSSDQKEWHDLLMTEEIPPLKSLSLKLKLASLKANIKIETMTVAEAIVQLHNYCAANEKMYATDLENLFGQ
ncbi:MAG: hypothetical protein ACRBFS_12370 [Aureispira sp.]